jgi:hypothetical protein
MRSFTVLLYNARFLRREITGDAKLLFKSLSLLHLALIGGLSSPPNLKVFNLKTQKKMLHLTI